ncbi:MAG: recombinase family protein, partial [Verrucomicrobia bacterium]|nr:recombinase family protein [Verrucomicrobiota bacterium]
MTEALRIAGYCRTSGEGQRDNTSIPRQREAIEDYGRANGWALVHVYIDESKSGSKVEGRDEFQQMMRDAANEAFDGVVVYDITRFARSGADIIDRARFLKSTFGVFLVDTKERFDTRKARNALSNHVLAGISEHERLSIMERTIGGRVARAKEGRPWVGSRPFGREYNKETGQWYLTEAGHSMRALLARYAEGEYLSELHKEYGFSSVNATMRIIRDSQLSGTYLARFHSPEIDIVNLEVPIPGIPEIIAPELAERVRQRRTHNRTYNKERLRKYRLSGYVRCGECGASLVSDQKKGHQYYRHHARTKEGGKGCGFHSIRADLLEEQALGYLYRFYTDEPAFEEAVRQAMPTGEQRDALAAELGRERARQAKVDRSIANLVHAIEEGADPTMLINRQQELREEREVCAMRVEELDEELASMPSVEYVEKQAKAIQLVLFLQNSGKNWWEQEFESIRQFLRFLFGDNPRQKGYGICVRREQEGWRVEFRGRVQFGHELHNGLPTTDAFRRAVRSASNLIQTNFEIALQAADREYAEASGMAEPNMPNQLIWWPPFSHWLASTALYNSLPSG